MPFKSFHGETRKPFGPWPYFRKWVFPSPTYPIECCRSKAQRHSVAGGKKKDDEEGRGKEKGRGRKVFRHPILLHYLLSVLMSLPTRPFPLLWIQIPTSCGFLDPNSMSRGRPSLRRVRIKILMETRSKNSNLAPVRLLQISIRTRPLPPPQPTLCLHWYGPLLLCRTQIIAWLYGGLAAVHSVVLVYFWRSVSGSFTASTLDPESLWPRR
mmetsp:Transcript_9607/g.17963  ORF Transcript_9607/g.17963 Transcript_9607/m.17963 type:complete len:211 (+) Transcript_9607:538-1170(+)